MDRELIDRAWRCLLHEFKEKVKKEYARCVKIDADDNPNLPAYAVKSAISRRALLEKLFGEHNLTSDAEGEEVLMVKAKTVREMYALNEDILFLDPTHKGAILLKKKLQDLFGSKCLPDEKEFAKSANCLEPQPAEPKFKVNDVVRTVFNEITHITSVLGNGNYYLYGMGNEYPEDSLTLIQPYTEPTNEGTRQEQCVSKNAESGTHSFDNIIKDSFRNERRLNIAAMAMQGMLSNTARFSNYEISDLVRISLNCADALIKKMKGGSDE